MRVGRVYSRTVPNPVPGVADCKWKNAGALTDPAAGMVLAATFPPLDRSVGMFVRVNAFTTSPSEPPSPMEAVVEKCREVTDVTLGGT